MTVLLLLLSWSGATDSSERIRQETVMQSAAIVVVATFLLILWVVLFSRLSIRSRWRLLVGCLFVAASFVGFFRYRGVSGDLVPQFELRFPG